MADGNSDENLERAFRFIRDGNKQLESKVYWRGTDSYSQAQTILLRLAEEAAPNAAQGDVQAKIAALYHNQSAEYLHRARGALISALQEETTADQAPGASHNVANSETTPTLLSGLSEEDCVYRMKLFGRLFAKEVEDPKTIREQESSLEARLRQLNDSLPSAYKSEKERMRDLNCGLARLGLPLFHHDSADAEQQRGRASGIGDAVPKSEAEQVDWIIAQAKDEVAIAGDASSAASMINGAAAADTLTAGGSMRDNTISDGDDDDDSVEFSTGDGDASLTPEICKGFHSKLVAAQVSLSELVALFDVDQDNDASIEFEQARGKKLLSDTRLLLRQVTEKWAAC